MGCAERKKGAHSAGKMNRTAGLFDAERLGTGEKLPQLGGFSGGFEGDRVSDSLLSGGAAMNAGDVTNKEEMLRLMSGGARRRRRTQRRRKSVRRTRVKGRNTFRIRFTGQVRLKQRHRQ
jgi:hypothetical protein